MNVFLKEESKEAKGVDLIKKIREYHLLDQIAR